LVSPFERFYAIGTSEALAETAAFLVSVPKYDR
jgi:hypothetical protein